MNAGLRRNWNAVVQPEDTVYHLGDFAMGDKKYWPLYRRQLNGRIIFITGNHDEPLARWRKLLLPGDEEHENLVIDTKYGKMYLHHEPSHLFISAKCAYHLCGHVHTAWKRKGRVINVGVDVWDYKPVTIDTLIEADESENAIYFTRHQ